MAAALAGAAALAAPAPAPAGTGRSGSSKDTHASGSSCADGDTTRRCRHMCLYSTPSYRMKDPTGQVLI